MNRRIVYLMLLKEIRYATRNRSLMLLLLVVPLLIFPVFILVPPILANPRLDSSPVLIINLDIGGQGANLTRQISQTPGLAATLGGENSSAEAAVQSGLFDAAVVIPQNFSSTIAQNRTGTLQVFFDSAYSRSIIALQLIEGAILSYSQQLSILRNPSAASSIPVGLAPTPLRAVRPLIATVVFLLPYLWVIWATILGGFLALDMTSTERRESTLPVLFTLPYTRFEIYSGKVAAIIFMAVFAALVGVAGIYLIPTMGVLLGSGLRDVNVLGSISLSSGLLGVMALTVGFSFASSASLLHFLRLFMTGASRKKLAFAGILTGLAVTGLVMSGVTITLGLTANLLPFVGAHALLANAVSGAISLGEVALLVSTGVLFVLLFVLLSYRELAGDRLLLRSYFKPSVKVEETLPESRAETELGEDSEPR